MFSSKGTFLLSHYSYFRFQRPRGLCIVKDYRNSVLLSKSHDIYTNLAFEDFLYKHVKFSQPEASLLLMWYNGPAVVIGRHQNPWIECHIDFLNSKGISLVRRNSGGGTVYHDLGNLNCSFFTSRKKYNRTQNLKIISQALKKYWNIDSMINKREDLVIMDEYKISGTASKLGATSAYHHCTVLVNVNTSDLKKALKTTDPHITSKATSSVPSKIKNIQEACSGISVRELAEKIAIEYQLHFNLDPVGVTLINPSENTSPVFIKSLASYKSWDWIYGKTPRFSIKKSFLIPSEMEFDSIGATGSMIIEIIVYNGIIDDAKLENFPLNFECSQSFYNCLKGEKFLVQDVEFASDQWVTLNILNEEMNILEFVAQCLIETVRCAYR